MLVAEERDRNSCPRTLLRLEILSTKDPRPEVVLEEFRTEGADEPLPLRLLVDGWIFARRMGEGASTGARMRRVAPTAGLGIGGVLV